MASTAAAASPATYTTPTKRAAFVNAEAGPSRARPAGASPAYSSRRHSLYGIEDRIVIDPGSRSWKVGFSGEVDPRSVFSSTEASGDLEAWDLDISHIVSARGDRAEARRIISGRVLRRLRETYTKHLMTDPKSRKVIIIENTYLPVYVKDQIAKFLFDDLKIPSVSFTPSSVLALAACGRVTGLVVDCGWLETTVTPVYHSRPLFHLARSTPIAGRRLYRRLKALLRHHAIYYPPPASLSSPSRQPVQPIPIEILSDNLVTRILHQACFVGNVMTTPYSGPELGGTLSANLDEMDDTELMARLQSRYAPVADATDLQLNIAALPTEPQGMGPTTLIVPGWLRERAAEVLFGDEDGESETITDCILRCLLKLPTDLRSTMISSMLITGGTPSLPGFIPRLRVSLLQNLLPLPSAPSSHFPLHTPEARMEETKTWRKRHEQPYRDLYSLSEKLAILNDPCPLDGTEGGKGGGGPRWRSGLMSWVGGSLAGALKTGGREIMREEYDTISQSHSERGQIFQHKLAETAAAAAMLTDSTETSPSSVSPPVQAVQIEDLLPGMAIGGVVGRKRGWSADAHVSDWTRCVKT